MRRPIETKTAAGAGGAGLALVLTFVARLFGLDLPAEVAAGLATILAGFAAYEAPHTYRPDLGDPPKGRHHADVD